MNCKFNPLLERLERSMKISTSNQLELASCNCKLNSPGKLLKKVRYTLIEIHLNKLTNRKSNPLVKFLKQSLKKYSTWMAIRKPLELCGDLTSLIIYGRRPSVLSDREMVEYTKRERGDFLCVYNDKEVSKVTLDRWSPRIINGKSLIMTPRYILIPDPIQFYNHLIRIVSLSEVDAFLCSYYLFFIKDAAVFIKLFTSIESQYLLILIFSFFFRRGCSTTSLDWSFSCSAKLP